MAVEAVPARNFSVRSSPVEMHLWPEDPQCRDGFITHSVVIECGAGEQRRLWYRVPEQFGSFLALSCDPFVIGLIYMAMEREAAVRVHGTVSPTLLENLVEFQMIWQRWHPDKYAAVGITADVEGEQSDARYFGRAVCAFTGGIDSCFTIYRHKRQLCGRLSKDVDAGLFVHGFDIPLPDYDAFERAAARAGETLSSIGVNLITMATNHKELNPDWNYTHGAGIASCLALLSGRYDYGLLGATYTYRFLDKSWGSHPLTDRLLSPGKFQIIHDAAGYGRATKLQTVAAWTEAYNKLRVCWTAPRKDENCGRCGKCVITMLSALFHKLPLPESFPTGISEDTLLALRDLDADHTSILSLSLPAFKSSTVPAPLVRAMERCVKYNERRLSLEEPAKNQVESTMRRWALDVHKSWGP